jgi:trans-2,3-dihydro-3-hydroxyanthranilate isomerase
VGVIKVDVFSEGGEITNIVMNQKKPEFFRTYSPEEVMPVFGLSPEDLYPGAVIQTVSTGTPQLMVPVKDIEVLKRVSLDIPGYMDLRQRGDFFSPHLFVLQGLTEEGDTFARHFGVPPDTPEDPFTGSATGGMAAYLWHHGLIKGPTFVAQQGHWMARPGVAQVEAVGPPEDIETVRVGGQAVLVLKGEFII